MVVVVVGHGGGGGGVLEVTVVRAVEAVLVVSSLRWARLGVPRILGNIII